MRRSCLRFGDSNAKDTTPERVTIFSDAQAAIRRMASDDPGPGQKYAIQAQRHIAALRRAKPGITIEIRWCPAHKGIAGNEKADEWAKEAAGQPGSHGPLPRSLANLKREISEKKWAEARRWAGAAPPRRSTICRKAKSPVALWPAAPRLASRYYQLKTGHARTGQYLHWVKVRPDAQCWWCKCPSQTRDHLFKVCLDWKMQQKVLWAEVLKETKRWKSRWTVRDLLADRRCGRAVLDFLTSTDVGRLVPPLEENGAGSQASEWELRERRERGEKNRRKRQRRWALWGRAGRNSHCSFPPPIHGIGRRVGDGSRVSLFSPLSISLDASTFSWDRPARRQRRACNGPPLRGRRTGDGLYMISLWSGGSRASDE